MIYCCVLTVYNTLYKYVNTQRDGFCQNLSLLVTELVNDFKRSVNSKQQTHAQDWVFCVNFEVETKLLLSN